MKAQVMKRAWQITREAIEKFGGNAKMYFGNALHQAWAESQNGLTGEQIRKLEKKGFNRWQKGDMDRLYADARTLGVEFHWKKRMGDFDGATFDGVEYSCRAANELKYAKTYIDVKTGKINSTKAELARAAQRMTCLPMDTETAELVASWVK